MKYKIGSLVRLVQGDMDTLYLVVGHAITSKMNIYIKAVDELDSKPQSVDESMVRQETVSDETHKKIITKWINTKLGRQIVRAMTS